MMKKSGILLTLSMIGLLFLASCASVGHGYIMRGSILEVKGKNVYLCIGSKDGAKAGDEFNVHKNRLVTKEETNRGLKQEWVKEQTGSVKIVEIVNEHYAKGIITSGKAEVHSVVELK